MKSDSVRHFIDEKELMNQPINHSLIIIKSDMLIILYFNNKYVGFLLKFPPCLRLFSSENSFCCNIKLVFKIK